MLFHGNPYLIEGFNTFLPPGYHINASTDPRDPGLITVTTPLGTMTSKISAGTLSAAAGALSYFTSPLPFGPPAAGSRPDSPLARSQPPQTFSPAPQGLTTAVASVLGNMGNKTQAERAPAAEFDHAILYLNKIKIRYPDDQNNTYKQFLEILQTYRKEQQNSLKDPIGYQQREQRMMHDVRVLSYSGPKWPARPILFRHKWRRSSLS
jgi:paired amphipathic helix protein Sin3a